MTGTTDLQTPAVLTLKQASALGYGAVATLRAHIASGKLPAYKVGGGVRVRLHELEAFVQPMATGPAVPTVSPALQATAQEPTPEPNTDIVTRAGETMDEVIERIVRNAPELTETQYRRLAVLLENPLREATPPGRP